MPKPRKPQTLMLATALHPREVFAIAERLSPGGVLGVAEADHGGHLAITYAGLRISRDLHPDLRKAVADASDPQPPAPDATPAIARVGCLRYSSPQPAAPAATPALDDGELVVGVVLLREKPGYSLRVLEMPPDIAAKYTVHAGPPDVLGNGLDQARAILKEVQG